MASAMRLPLGIDLDRLLCPQHREFFQIIAALMIFRGAGRELLQRVLALCLTNLPGKDIDNPEIRAGQALPQVCGTRAPTT